MKRFRITLTALGATSLLLLSSACGGGSGDVPAGAVAVVDGTEISKADLDALLERAKRGYEAQDQEFPKVGTQEYQSLQTQYVEFLVQREEFEQAAEDLDVTFTEEDVDKAVADFVKTRYGGKQDEFQKALREQGYTEETFRQTLALSVLADKLFEKVTAETKVTEQDILAYYTQNISQYRTPESRDVRHILIQEKKADDQIDFATSKTEAERIYEELRNGADFAALVKESSADTQSKASGGKLTISRGQTVPEFDKVAFELKRGALSRPVKTTYGYHVIEALSEIRKAKVTSLDDVRATIRASLLQEKKNDVMTAWVEDLRKDYEGKVSYAAGYEPPALPEPTTTDTETSETE